MCSCNEGPGSVHANIFRRIPYPIQPFGLDLLPRELAPSLLKGHRNGLRQQPGLFDKINNGSENDLK